MGRSRYCGVLAGVLIAVTCASTADADTPICTIAGTAGDDVLHGTSGPDVICGLAGKDKLYGRAGDDVLVGGGGGDLLDGGGDDDVLDGENGPDTLIGGDGADVFDGGVGVDAVSYAALSGDVTVTIGTGADDGLAGEHDDVRNTNEHVVTGAGNDTVIGSPHRDALSGGAGNDRVHGGGGRDSLTGGPGDDTLDGGTRGIGEPDSLSCGTGTDSYNFDVVDTVTACETRLNPPTRVDAYSNYGPAVAGHAMCRGNPGRPESMPGGTASQTFTVPSSVASLDTALVQIDPDPAVAAHWRLLVNGSLRATATSAAAGDTRFDFGAVPVHGGDQITFSVAFTATFGKIITVYSAAPLGGLLSIRNSCPDGAPNLDTGNGIRAVVSGWTP